MGLGKSWPNPAVNLSVAGIVVRIKLRRKRGGTVTKSKEFSPPGNAIITVGAHRAFVVALIINSLKATSRIGPLEEAIPFTPVAQPAPIYAIVNRPASDSPRAREAAVAGGVDRYLIGGHDKAQIRADLIGRARGQHPI